MLFSRKLFSTFIAAPLAMTAVSLLAADAPSPKAKSAVAIAKVIEAKKVGIITNLEFDNGEWEVEVYDAGKETKFYLNSETAEIRHQKSEPESSTDLPPKDAKALSDILGGLEGKAPGVISEAEFDHGQWEVEFRQGSMKTSMNVDAKTGTPKG